MDTQTDRQTDGHDISEPFEVSKKNCVLSYDEETKLIYFTYFITY